MTRGSIAVIGSRGFVGAQLVRFLRSQERDVVEYSSKIGNFVRPDGLGLVEDFNLPVNCDCVVYLAQSPNYRKVPELYEELALINSTLPFTVAKKAIQRNVQKFLYFSTGSVYQMSKTALHENSLLNRDSPYALSKIHGEENLLLLKNNINICCVRPFAMFGEGQEGMLVSNLVKSIKAGLPITLDTLPGDTEFDGLKISLIHVHDVVSAINELLDSTLPPVMNLAGDRALSIKEISESIGKGLKIQPIYNMKEQLRNGNLIADISTLKSILTNFPSPNLEDQIAKVAFNTFSI